MTSLNEARESIYQLFNTGWGTETAIVFDQETFDGADDEWVRLSVRHLGSTQDTFGTAGNRKFERQGTAFVELFFRPDPVTAQTEIDRLAQKAKDIFEGNRISGTTLRFNDTPIRELGIVDEWYVVVVDAAFLYNETK